MTDFFSGTDSAGMFDSDSSSSSSSQSSSYDHFPSDLSNVTRSDDSMESLSFGGEVELVRQARGVVSEIENGSVVEQARSLLSIIQKAIWLMRSKRPGPSDVPPLIAYAEEDGSMLLEWIFHGFRIGFNIEPDPENSGWYLVTNKEAGDQTGSGSLGDVPSTISNLTSFICQNT